MGSNEGREFNQIILNLILSDLFLHNHQFAYTIENKNLTVDDS